MEKLHLNDEMLNARRALRTASWAAIFYLITTDILGPFNAPYAFSQVGYVPGTILYVVSEYLVPSLSFSVSLLLCLFLDNDDAVINMTAMEGHVSSSGCQQNQRCVIPPLSVSPTDVPGYFWFQRHSSHSYQFFETVQDSRPPSYGFKGHICRTWTELELDMHISF